jgi:hypothetical protein
MRTGQNWITSLARYRLKGTPSSPEFLDASYKLRPAGEIFKWPSAANASPSNNQASEGHRSLNSERSSYAPPLAAVGTVAVRPDRTRIKPPRSCGRSSSSRPIAARRPARDSGLRFAGSRAQHELEPPTCI